MARAADRAYALRARAGRGHDPHRHARDGAPRSPPSSRTCPRPRLGAEADAERPGPADRRRARARARGRRGSRSSAAPSCCRSLREAGVVDAGGYGVTVIFAGVVAALRGDERARARAPPRAGARSRHPEHESSTYRYCTNFAVTGTGLERAARFVARARGDRRLGARRRRRRDAEGPRPHRRARAARRRSSPARARSRASTSPTCARRSPSATRAPRSRSADAARRRGAAARSRSSPAPGSRACSTALGAHVLDGGPTLNPSTYELLAGIHAVPAEEVVVLPNSPNVIMAAERAAELSEKRSSRRAVALAAGRPRGGASRSTPSAAPAENAAAMDDALDAVRTGRRRAGRARRRPRAASRVGDAVGFVDEELVAWGEPRPTLARRPRRASADDAELVTCIAGDGAPLDDDASRRSRPTASSSSSSDGGQPSLLVAARPPSSRRSPRVPRAAARRSPEPRRS